MSCRAMGFDLERLAPRLVMDAEPDARAFIGRFVPTDRNTPASDLFARNGFTQASATEWSLGEAAIRPAAPEWFEVAPR